MGLITSTENLIASIIIIVIVAAAIFWYFGQGIENVSLEKFEITRISGVSPQSFKLEGNFHVKNPSNLTVPVDTIVYEIILKETGEVIGEGTMPRFNLERQKVSVIPFIQEVRWAPATSMAVDLVMKDQVVVIVKGELRFNINYLREYTIPFYAETDIKDYVRQHIPGIDYARSIVQQANDTGLLDNVLSIVG